MSSAVTQKPKNTLWHQLEGNKFSLLVCPLSVACSTTGCVVTLHSRQVLGLRITFYEVKLVFSDSVE